MRRPCPGQRTHQITSQISSFGPSTSVWRRSVRPVFDTCPMSVRNRRWWCRKSRRCEVIAIYGPDGHWIHRGLRGTSLRYHGCAASPAASSSVRRPDTPVVSDRAGIERDHRPGGPASGGAGGIGSILHRVLASGAQHLTGGASRRRSVNQIGVLHRTVSRWSYVHSRGRETVGATHASPLSGSANGCASYAPVAATGATLTGTGRPVLDRARSHHFAQISSFGPSTSVWRRSVRRP